jgi:hypothetical protein
VQAACRRDKRDMWDRQDMSEQTSNQPQVVAGHARAECRVAIWMRCPRCQQEHGHILTARDHPHLGGLRYWRVQCHGVRYMLRLSSAQIAAALDQAAAISMAHALSQRWLSADTYEHCGPDAG